MFRSIEGWTATLSAGTSASTAEDRTRQAYASVPRGPASLVRHVFRRPVSRKSWRHAALSIASCSRGVTGRHGFGVRICDQLKLREPGTKTLPRPGGKAIWGYWTSGYAPGGGGEEVTCHISPILKCLISQWYNVTRGTHHSQPSWSCLPIPVVQAPATPPCPSAFTWYEVRLVPYADSNYSTIYIF